MRKKELRGVYYVLKVFITRNIKYILVILTVACLMLFFINKKEGFHEDEIFSYGSASYFYDNVFRPYGIEDSTGEFVRKNILKGNIFKNLKYYLLDHRKEMYGLIEKYKAAHRPVWRSPKDADDYLTVKGWKEVVNYPISYYNQAKDVHPPLFYFLVHTVQILFYGKFSKYIVFLINICFAIPSLVLIKRLMEKMGKEQLAIPAMILYGFSMGAMCTAIFQRMYMMLSFFILMFISVNFDIVKNNYEIDKKTWRWLGLVAILGYLTQYYFCIFAAGVAFVVFINVCRSRDKKRIVSYILGYLKIALIGIILYPFSINHVFFSYRGVGVSVMHKGYLEKLSDYLSLVSYSFSLPVLLIGLILIAMVVCSIIRRREIGDFISFVSLLFIPLIIYVLIVVKTAPEVEYVHTLRYLMCVLPVISILMVLSIDLFIRNIMVSQVVLIALTVGISIYGLATSEPFFLYKGYSRYIEIAEENKNDRFVYVGDTVFNHIQSMQEFAIYRESLILNEGQLDSLTDNKELETEDEFILSIKKYKGDEYILEQIIENTDFKDAELLYDDDGEVGCIIYRMKRVENEV